MNPISALLTALGVLTAGFVVFWSKHLARDGQTRKVPSLFQVGLGAVTNFFDALGIGSFATTTTVFKLRRMVDDRIIPGTLNVGHTLPTVAQAFIYTAVIPVDVLTLITMIVAAVLGGWLGAGVVAKWPRRNVQIGMGAALLAFAVFALMRQLSLFPAGSEEIGVRGARLMIAIGGNFMLGALMTLGIGLYAPCMILVSLLGMSERTAFPIMMGSCAFLMPFSSARFIRERAYDARNAIGLALGGIPGVLVAAYIVKQLPLYWVRWLVIVVVVYTGLTMLYSAFTERPQGVPARKQVGAEG
jgi:uncharacterized membrane protein YfcA